MGNGYAYDIIRGIPNVVIAALLIFAGLKLLGLHLSLIHIYLDVLLELCDRIVVLCGGKVNGILDGRKTTKEEVGLRMTNLVKEEQA